MALWIKEQLDRIRGFLTERDADTDMIEAVHFLIQDNERWIRSADCGRACSQEIWVGAKRRPTPGGRSGALPGGVPLS